MLTENTLNNINITGKNILKDNFRNQYKFRGQTGHPRCTVPHNLFAPAATQRTMASSA